MIGHRKIPQYEVLDENGHKTGQILNREEIHDRELWHEVVNVWIINDRGEVLLQLRARDVEICPDVWDVSIGTHELPGENPLVAAVRCLQNELGINVLPEKLKHLFNIRAANPMGNGKKHRVFGHVFLLKQDIVLDELKVDNHKISELAWKPLVRVMADIGSTEMRGKYFPREGAYYPMLFDALMAEAPPEIAS